MTGKRRVRKRFPLSLTYDNRRLVLWRHRSRLEIVTSQCLFDLGAWWRLENRNNYLMNRKERISRCPKNWRFVASRIRIIFLVEPFIQNTESNRIHLEHFIKTYGKSESDDGVQSKIKIVSQNRVRSKWKMHPYTVAIVNYP